MFVARDKNWEVKLFNTKPIRADNAAWKEDGFFQHYLYLSPSLFTELTWEDEPEEVIVLPMPTEENIMTNPIYKAIYDMGKKDGLELSEAKNKPFNFTLSEETKSIIEEDTGKTIEELKNTPITQHMHGDVCHDNGVCYIYNDPNTPQEQWRY